LLFCRKNGENKRRTVMQKNFTLSVLNIIQPELMTRELSHLGEVALFYGLSLDYETYFRYIKIVAL
ncbi:hypothetical protein, partial [Ligilactobacillus salivarius]|uniref:hypothetical protein n=2 Tax=Ligilactobacillus salivarius TaxID=1624 RepID=UPI001CDB1B27